MLLFQSIKMTPGLVGQWAEFVRDYIYVENIAAFRSKVAWLWKISEDSVIEKNWELLFKYLSVWEIYQQLPESREFIDLEEKLVDAQVSIKGVGGGRLHMVPVCFVLIAQVYRGSLHQELKTMLEELFMSIANYKSDANAKNGDFLKHLHFTHCNFVCIFALIQILLGHYLNSLVVKCTT